MRKVIIPFSYYCQYKLTEDRKTRLLQQASRGRQGLLFPPGETGKFFMFVEISMSEENPECVNLSPEEFLKNDICEYVTMALKKEKLIG